MKKTALIFLAVGIACAGGAIAAFGLGNQDARADLPDSLRVGIHRSYKPFSYLDEAGVRRGFDHDMAHALCRKLDIRCTLVPLSFDSLLSSLKSGELDAVVAGLGATESRLADFVFSNPYYSTRSLFITNDRTIGPVSEADPRRLAIGVVAGTIQDHIISTYYEKTGATVVRYRTFDEQLEALKRREVNAIFKQGLTGYAFLKSPQGRGFFIGGLHPEVDPNLTQARIAFRKDRAELVEHFDDALMQLKACGKYQQISMQYLPYMSY